jgi:hypothetical protein
MIKREVVMLAALIVLLSASVAGGLQQRVQATAATAQQTTAQPGIQVDAFWTGVSGTCSYTPRTGYKLVAVYCEVKNVAAPGLTVDPSDWRLDLYGPVYMVMTRGCTGFPHVDNTQPGDFAFGPIVFEIPSYVQPTSITYYGPVNSVTINL